MHYAHRLPNKGGIYRIRNKNNGTEYIGESKNIRNRAVQHINQLNKHSHHCRYLQNSWNRHGNNAFVIEVIELISDQGVRLERERYFIRKTKRCYNVMGNANREYPVTWQEEDDYHDRFTKHIGKGKKYKRPKWHGWVYGGDKNPVNTRRMVNRHTGNENPSVTSGNKKDGTHSA